MRTQKEAHQKLTYSLFNVLVQKIFIVIIGLLSSYLNMNYKIKYKLVKS